MTVHFVYALCQNKLVMIFAHCLTVSLIVYMSALPTRLKKFSLKVQTLFAQCVDLLDIFLANQTRSAANFSML